MTSSQVQVPWPAGLHLRPAARLVRLAQTFRCKIFLTCGGKLADARSILSVLLLTASMGSVISIETSGEDEKHAARAIEQIFAADNDGGADYQQPG